MIKCSQEFILLPQKHSSTYHKKHHLFLIRQYCLRNHLSHHKYSNHKCICRYYIEIADGRMMVFLNVRKNEEKTKKSHLKHYSLQLQLVFKLRLLKFIDTQKYYFPVKTWISVCCYLFSWLQLFLLPFT